MKRLDREVSASEFERQTSFVLRPSLHEVLGNANLAYEAFGLDAHQQQMLCEQVLERQELAEYVNACIDKLPSPYLDMREAVAQGYISSTEVAELYARLNGFLSDPAATRVVLYMPLEWLPDMAHPSDDQTLRAAEEGFCEAYVDAWWSLLREHDVRAHFDDGDMRLDIDASTETLPRVVKAAHLIPFILGKGLISEADVAYIHDGTNSLVLRQSIDEAMAVYRHIHDASGGTPPEKVTTEVTPEMVHDYHAQQLSHMCAEKEAEASPQRLEWLEKVAFEATVQDMAARLSAEQAREFLVSDDEMLRSVACIALGHIAHTTLGAEARTDVVTALLEHGSSSIKYYSITLLQLYRAGYVIQEELDRRGIRVPLLHGELSYNLNLDTKEMETVRNYIDAVRQDPELAAQLYPAVLVGGSRLKGYGGEHSDIDVTICVRPGVDAAVRDALLERIVPLLGGEKPHEFWLEERGHYLAIRTLDVDDQFVGNDYWVHVLFGGAWVGDDAAVRVLQSKLYPPYFTERYFEGTDMPLQPAYRRRIEDDVLLYRLLHRGYAHQFSTHSLETPHAELIDGHGVFYDSGYRQLATQLFIEKVFLPNLSSDN